MCIAQTNTLTLDLFVKSYSGALMATTDFNAATAANGSMDNPFFFL
jgi:hypothetical protein